jgi:hypothetical protein
MGTTATWLQAQEHARVAFVLAFEGLNLLVTTTDDTAGILTAWSGTDWTTCVSGLDIVGEVSQQAEPFDGTIRPSNLTFTATDYNDTLLQFFRSALSTANRAILASDVDSNDTTLTITGGVNTAWSTTADVYFGATETATASAKPTSTTFTVTRGKWALHGTSSSSTRFGRPHVQSTDGSNFRPIISDSAQTHYNRSVSVYAHHYVDGAWSTKANAELLWTGRIKTITDHGDGRVSFACLFWTDALSTRLLAEQYTGTVRESVYVSSSQGGVYARSRKVTSAGVIDQKAAVTAVLDTVDDFRELGELDGDISTELQIWNDAGSVHGVWSLSHVARSDGSERYRFAAYISAATSTEDYHLTIGLSGPVAFALGFGTEEDPMGPSVDIGDGRTVFTAKFEPTANATRYELMAKYPPNPYVQAGGVSAGQIGRLRVDNVKGTWGAQPQVPSWVPRGDTGAVADGFLMLGGKRVLAVQETVDGVAGDYRILSDVTNLLGEHVGGLAAPEGTFRDDLRSAAEPVEVRQVWLDERSAYDIWSRLLLSTGTADYNHALDDYPRHMGASVPYTLLDLDSLQRWRRLTYTLLIDKPTPLIELLEKWLQFTGCYLVFDGGRFVVKSMGAIGPAATTVCAFTESNKAQPDDSPTVTVGDGGILNRVTMKYARGLDGKYRVEEQVNNQASQSDFGGTRGVSFEAPGVYRERDVAVWRDTVQATALAYFGRPLAQVERTYDFSLETQFTPGDLVTLTDNRVIDPRTGTRGVTEMPCWVLSKSFNWTTGVGRVTLAFSPELDSTKVPAWAPSALVTGYVDGTKTLTCSAHQFSGSSDAADASYFPAGSKVHVYKLDVASPTEYFDTVASQTGNTIVLTTGLGGAIPAGSFVVESDDATTATSTQFTRYAYIADDADYSTDRSANDYKLYGSSSAPVSTTVDYTQYYITHSSTADDVGEPLSAHKFYLAVNWLNSALSNATRVTLADTFTAEVSVEGENFNLAYGPVFVPMPGGNRTVNVAIQGYVTAGTATFRIVLSGVMVGGTALAPTYGDGGTTRTDLTTTGTTLRTVEGSILFPNRLTTFEGVPGAWLTVEAKTSTQVDFAKLRGITVSEATLS